MTSNPVKTYGLKILPAMNFETRFRIRQPPSLIPHYIPSALKQFEPKCMYVNGALQHPNVLFP